MPRLHFDEPIVEDELTIERIPARAALPSMRLPTPPRKISHRMPVCGPDDGPVIDCEGLRVWRVKVYGLDEVTCLACGESFPGRWKFCPRCNGDEIDPKALKRTNTKPTVTYLREGEYEIK